MSLFLVSDKKTQQLYKPQVSSFSASENNLTDQKIVGVYIQGICYPTIINC